LLVTVTCGGASVGYKAMGSVGMQTAPARIISRAQTVANTGRWIKKSTKRTLPFACAAQEAAMPYEAQRLLLVVLAQGLHGGAIDQELNS
jgi:hypothetical protein